MRQIHASTIALTLLALLLPTAASAEFYAGASLTRNFIKANDVIEYFDIQSDIDHTDNSYAAHLGYEWTPYLALETGYSELEASGWNAEEVTIKTKSFSLSFLGKYPMTEQFDLYGRLGLEFWDADVEVKPWFPALPIENQIPDDDGVSILAGVGASYSITNHWSARFEYSYRRWEIDKFNFNVNSLALGFSYHF